MNKLDSIDDCKARRLYTTLRAGNDPDTGKPHMTEDEFVQALSTLVAGIIGEDEVTTVPVHFIDLETTTEDERMAAKGKIVAFCLNNGFMFDDDDDEVIIYIPKLKRAKELGL